MKKIILAILLMTTTATAAFAQDDTVWDGSTVSTLYYEKNNIYIYTAAELASLKKLWKSFSNGKQGYQDYTIWLMDDLDMNNKNFVDYTIGYNDEHMFSGTFDGQGHTIRNLKIRGENSNRGLFGWIDKGTVKNLKLVDVDIEAGDDDCDVGAICGKMTNHSTVSHCAVVGGTVESWESNYDRIGGICGWMSNNHNTIEFCYVNDVTVKGDKQVGGIVGRVERGDDKSSIVKNCYFVGKIKHGDEYFGAIAGERYSQPMKNNFFLDRKDGVRATGNDEDYDGSSYHSVKGEIKECTEEEMKQPLLFALFGEQHTEYIYPFNDYPELKVFLRYNVGDTFYNTSIGYMDNNADNAVPGYVKVQNNTSSPYAVSLEKMMPASAGTDFTLTGDFQPYFGDQQLRMVGIAPNAMEVLGVVNTVTVPATVDSIAYPQRHQVQNAFILNGTNGAVKDGALYDLTRKYLITAPKTFSTLTIHQEFADQIADYAFENMSNLRTIYVDTYVPAGTLVDEKDNPAPTINLEGENIFNGCPADLDVYIKDGTSNQLIIGKQGPKGYGYSNADGWMFFYSDYQDVENHMFPYFPVNRNPSGKSTLMLGYPVELPEGVTAWWARSFGDSKVNMEKLGTQIVPALTPVLLTYEGTGMLYLSRYTGSDAGAATDYESNLLKGSVDPGGHTMTSSEMMSNFFTLGRPKGDSTYERIGFYPYHPKNNVLPSYVAWIASSDIPAEAQFVMNFDEEPIITNITLQPSVTDELRVYTLQGVRIEPSAMQKGAMYIVNGKKVINP